MGTCASALSKTAEPDKEPLSKTGPLGAPVSRRYLQTNHDAAKRNMADTIATAFVAHTPAEVDSNKGLKARLTNRQGAADARHTSAQTAQLGITASPTAESVPDLEPFQAKVTGGKALLSCDQLLTPSISEDSFEATRADTARKISMLQKNFQSGGGNSAMAWAVLCSDPNKDSKSKSKNGRGGGGGAVVGDTASARGFEKDGGDLSDHGGAVRSRMSEGRMLDTAVEVVRAEDCMGDGNVTEEMAAVGGLSTKTTATGMGTMTTAGALVSAEVEVEDMDETPPRKTLQRPTSRVGRCQPVATLPGVPASKSDNLELNSTRPVGHSPTAAAAAVATMAATCNAPTDPEASETDELRSLPLPNLVSGGATSGNVRQGAATSPVGKDGGGGGGHRHSYTAYAQKTSSPSGGGEGARGPPIANATRNSDLGYYLEEARFTSAAARPFHGAQPVRHSLLDSSFAAQRMAASTSAAVSTSDKPMQEGAKMGPTKLDYVPMLKPQPSRGSLLLVQPSTRRRLLPEPEGMDEQSETDPGVRAGGSGGVPVSGSGGSSGIGSPGPRRLEYQPTRNVSRKSARVSPASPASPVPCSTPPATRAVTSSSSLSVIRSSNHFSNSLRAVDSERTFQHARFRNSTGAAGPQEPGSAPLSGATQPRGGGGDGGDVTDPRVTNSASQVHFGSVETLVLTPKPAAQSPINLRHGHYQHQQHYNGGGRSGGGGAGVNGVTSSGSMHTQVGPIESTNAVRVRTPQRPDGGPRMSAAPPVIGRWTEGGANAAELPGSTTAPRNGGGGGGDDVAGVPAGGDGVGSGAAVGSVRTAARAARLLATLHRLGVGPVGEQNAVAA